MNEYEILRVIEFLEQTRAPFRETMPLCDDEPIWNITAFLMKSEIRGQMVTVSMLAQVTGVPYATSMRLIGRMVDGGVILRVPRGRTGKSHSLHPGDEMRRAFTAYARSMKALIARTVGLRGSGEDEEQYYFGGTPLASHPPPPPRLMERRAARDRHPLPAQRRQLLLGMRNMWVDLRSNLAASRDFSLRRLPDLHRELLANAQRPVSSYDVVTVNMPWLGEMAGPGAPAPPRPADLVRRPRSHRLPSGDPVHRRLAGRDVRRADLLHDRDPGGAQGPVRGAQPRVSEDLRRGDRQRRRFHQPEQGRYGIVFDGARGMPIASTFLFFLGACGSPPIAPKGGGPIRAGDAEEMISLIDGPAGRAALDYMRRLLEIAPPDALDLAWDQNLSLFLSGRASMAYCWTMRASRMEYDVQSVVKRKVEYLPQPAGPGGGRASPIGGFLLAIPANLPEDRVGLAAEAIAWMTSKRRCTRMCATAFPSRRASRPAPTRRRAPARRSCASSTASRVASS